MLFAISFIETAAAQVVIPYGDFDNDFEKYLVAAVSLAALFFRYVALFQESRIGNVRFNPESEHSAGSVQ